MDVEQLSPVAVRAAVEDVVRTDRARLVALLAASSGDIALAEDALATALERALRTWPADGVPANPRGWLLTVARNAQRDVWRSAAHRTTVPVPAAEVDADAAADGLGIDAAVVDPADADPDAIPDRRLQLLFACAHPAIDPAVRTPLMLQVVLGVDADRIAAAYAVSPAAMAKRLVRAKHRIRDTRIPFAIPSRADMPARLLPVLEAIYGCAAIAWREEAAGAASLAGEARHLATTLARLLGDEPEAWGLAALITLSHARAGRWPGPFVPLEDQDPARWDARLIALGEAHLRRAGRGTGPPGRFHLEAAIQAVHCDRARTGTTDWAALRTLYAALVAVAPSLGARIALAAVTGRVEGPLAGLDLLAAVEEEGEGAVRLQALHATRADLLVRAGRHAEAVAAYDAAIIRTPDRDAAVAAHLTARRDAARAQARD